jgi:DNA-binding XRE family transcriptional regulator
MARHILLSHIRIHRKKSGLSQRELAYVLGYASDSQVIQHERAIIVPEFLMALAYEALLQVPVSDLFPGFSQAVADAVETRLAELERTLQKKNAKGRNARATARKLEWIIARRTKIQL